MISRARRNQRGCALAVMNAQRRHPVSVFRARRVMRQLLRHYRIRAGMVHVVFVSRQRMRQLNHRYHRRNRVTDVLAFDLRWPAQQRRTVLVGDVIVAPGVARERAAEFRQTYHQELLTYVVHGALHLIGYRDDTAEGRRRMARVQWMLVHGKQSSKAAERQRGRDR